MQSIDKNGRATVGLARDAHEAWTGDGDRRGFIVPRTLWALRSQVCFAAAVAHARLRLSRLELIVGFRPSRRPLRVSSACLHFARSLLFRRVEALYGSGSQEGAGSGSQGRGLFSESSARGGTRGHGVALPCVSRLPPQTRCIRPAAKILVTGYRYGTVPVLNRYRYTGNCLVNPPRDRSVGVVRLSHAEDA